MLRVPTNPTSALIEIDLSDLSPEIRSALVALTEVETRYESDR